MVKEVAGAMEKACQQAGSSGAHRRDEFLVPSRMEGLATCGRAGGTQLYLRIWTAGPFNERVFFRYALHPQLWNCQHPILFSSHGYMNTWSLRVLYIHLRPTFQRRYFYARFRYPPLYLIPDLGLFKSKTSRYLVLWDFWLVDQLEYEKGNARCWRLGLSLLLWHTINILRIASLYIIVIRAIGTWIFQNCQQMPSLKELE